MYVSVGIFLFFSCVEPGYFPLSYVFLEKISWCRSLNERTNDVRKLKIYRISCFLLLLRRKRKLRITSFFWVCGCVCVRGIWLIENTFIIITIMVRAAASEFSFFFGLGKFEKCWGWLLNCVNGFLCYPALVLPDILLSIYVYAYFRLVIFFKIYIRHVFVTPFPFGLYGELSTLKRF